MPLQKKRKYSKLVTRSLRRPTPFTDMRVKRAEIKKIIMKMLTEGTKHKYYKKKRDLAADPALMELIMKFLG